MPSTLRIEKTVTEVSSMNPFFDRDVPEVSVPVRPKIGPRTAPETQLRLLQKYISQFQYNFLPRTFFNCFKYRPLNRILETAKEVVKESLPIRCLEATFLAVYLTQDLKWFDRCPLTFKTVFHGQTCRHIVLAVKCEGKGWGALGLSRKDDLMYKKLKDQTLPELVDDYREAYRRHGHEVLAVKVGLPVSHNSTSSLTPCWRFLCLSYKNHSQEEITESLNKYSDIAKKLAAEWEGMRHQTRNARLVKKVAPPPILTPAPLSSERSSSDCEDDEDGSEQYNDEAEMEDSDGDETNEVLYSILASRSPFRRNQFNNPTLAKLAAATPASPTQSQKQQANSTTETTTATTTTQSAESSAVVETKEGQEEEQEEKVEVEVEKEEEQEEK
eukprot:TRINITY_DN2934_c2_g1_i1.p1 TRINITY_DN2934_c2_g1~~TRINITY_DN2934_c2_g1_i1.p1  ORF type:complete len:403 (+),score=111.18 TRINITY_DN2934_c2_g1_i1:52-1209(+)